MVINLYSFLYFTAIPFNAIDNDEFVQMCETIGQFGVGFEPSYQDHLRGVLLNEEYARTKSLLQERDVEKEKHNELVHELCCWNKFY